MRSVLALVVAVAVVGGAGLATACREPTQIRVELTTDVVCSDVKGTVLTVGNLIALDGLPPTTQTPACDPTTKRIGSIVLLPSGANDDVVAIRIVMGVGTDPTQCRPPAYDGCIVARRAIRFVPHTSLTLPIFMAAVCKGIACGSTDTCVRGDCRAATIPDSTACETETGCDEASLAPGSSPDGGLPPIDGGACTANIASDPKNCGRCGHDCLGGACSQGACGPIVLVSGLSAPHGLSVDANNVYWTEPARATIASRPIDGGAPRTNLVTDGGTPFYAVVQNGSVYWTHRADPGTVNARTLATGQNRIIATGQSLPSGIDVIGSTVYWAEQNRDSLWMSLPDGGATVIRLGGLDYPDQITHDDAFFYVAASGDSIDSVPLAGGNQKLLVKGLAAKRPTGVAVDGAELYITLQGSGEIARMSKTGGAITVIASGQDAPAGIAFDDKAIYWANGGAKTGMGAIMRLAK